MRKTGEKNLYMSLILPGVGDVWRELVVVDWFAVETKKTLKTYKLCLASVYGDVEHHNQKEWLEMPS